MRREILFVAIAALGCSKLGTDPSWTERGSGGSAQPFGAAEDDVTAPPGALPGTSSTPGSSSFDRGDDGAPLPNTPQVGDGSDSDPIDPMAPDDDDLGSSDDDDLAPSARITEPGRLPLHHLTAAEYNTTVAHLLTTELRPADYFPASGSSEFDANVGVLANLSPVLVQGYYAAAKDLAADVMANPGARSATLDCDPAGVSAEQEDECVRTLIAGFGLRAFRRPLLTEELERYQGSYSRARGDLGMDQSAATEHLIRSLLSSPNFFLRVEAPQEGVDLAQTEAYALASRLSYLVWSSAPDAELYARAAAGELETSDDILREVGRMLDDERSHALLRDFVGQWLGLRRLPSHDVSASAFPEWNGEMLAAMSNQANTFISGFFSGQQRWADFLTLTPPNESALQPLLASDPEPRNGFLTLPAFLTLSSHSDRTSPTTRATTVLGGLLCTTITPPANVDIPDLSATGEGSLGEANIRSRLEQHREATECAGCHAILDPIGLSLERYDAIGQYRTHYGNGSEVDASGEYGGTAFEDVSDLVPLLASDARFARCPVEKLTSYALRRRASPEDRDTIDALASDWASGSLDDLLRRVVIHPMFSPAL